MGLTDKLDLLMAERKINKAELARESGVPYTTIDGFYKKGSENAKLSTLKKLCSYFGCTLDYLADDDIKEQPTIAAHFDGDEYTEEELDKIKEFAAFVKSNRKNKDKRMAQKTAPAPAADAPITFPDHLTVNAAHARNDVEATDEMQQHDEDIMDDENF